MRQQNRYRAALATAYGGWISAFILTFLRTQHDLPVWTGTVIVVLVGAAIAAGIALSRMRLQRTLVEVFNAGMLAAKAERDEIREQKQAEPK